MINAKRDLSLAPLALGLLALGLAAGAAQAAPIEGDWLTQTGGAKVRIAACPDQVRRLCGTIVWMSPAALGDGTDRNNPNPSLKARKLVGLSMLSDFRPDGSDRWTGGTIYDPRSGKTYASKLSAQPDGGLKVEGCVSIICRAQTWRRP